MANDNHTANDIWATGGILLASLPAVASLAPAATASRNPMASATAAAMLASRQREYIERLMLQGSR